VRQSAAEANSGLVRTALKMATGSGKTTGMGMFIAWQACNSATGGGKDFTDRFLGVHPKPGWACRPLPRDYGYRSCIMPTPV
jgi:type III restriction enzyme